MQSRYLPPGAKIPSMPLQSKTAVTVHLEAHTVAKLEDFAPNANDLETAILQALNVFFTQRDQAQAKP